MLTSNPREDEPRENLKNLTLNIAPASLKILRKLEMRTPPCLLGKFGKTNLMEPGVNRSCVNRISLSYSTKLPDINRSCFNHFFNRCPSMFTALVFPKRFADTPRMSPPYVTNLCILGRACQCVSDSDKG